MAQGLPTIRTYPHRGKYRRYEMSIRRKLLSVLGTCCACCGEDEPAFLTLDHVGGGGEAHRRRVSPKSHNVRHVYMEALSDPLKHEKYRILCWNCNCSTSGGRKCPHEQQMLRVWGKAL